MHFRFIPLLIALAFPFATAAVPAPTPSTSPATDGPTSSALQAPAVVPALPAPVPAPAPAPEVPIPVGVSQVANIFVHPLLAFPEKAFIPTSRDESRMDEWFVTADEFRRTLDSLDAKGYTLVRVGDVYQTGKDGVKEKYVPLPPGRKPLILSMDDLNYYPYMRANGTVSRLMVDDKNQLVARTALKDGAFRDDLDREAPQILETFLETHPEFSYNGARGMIALTGYNGVLGWPTQQAPGPKLLEAQKGASAVIQKLKEMGWEFASHSYAHRSKRVQDNMAWKVSEARWIGEVQSLIGQTPYYVFPFGEPWWKDSERWAVLKSYGFQIFFGVEATSNIRIKDGLPILGRVPLDGRGLRHRYGKLSVFLDPKLVWDPLRPLTMKY